MALAMARRGTVDFQSPGMDGLQVTPTRRKRDVSRDTLRYRMERHGLQR